jgi:hypothetical protein
MPLVLIFTNLGGSVSPTRHPYVKLSFNLYPLKSEVLPREALSSFRMSLSVEHSCNNGS